MTAPVPVGLRLEAPGFPHDEVRRRAVCGVEAVFPCLLNSAPAYGRAVFGETPGRGAVALDGIDTMRLVPPVLMPERLEQLIELGREPYYADVDLSTSIGGFASSLPVFVSAMGSTATAHSEIGTRLAVQAARAGIPLVVGENVCAVHGYDRRSSLHAPTFKERAFMYVDNLAGGSGGLVVQQSTEDADAELWNHVYSDPSFHPLVASGRLAFELKLGQGAKGCSGGITMVDSAAADHLADRFALEAVNGGTLLRISAPGTFTQDILRSQVRLIRNNFPDVRVWVKLPPGRDLAVAATTAWEAGADAVTVDAASGGSGLAPTALLQHLGLPLDACLAQFVDVAGPLLVSGRMWEGSRAVKALALGATAVGIGRAALLAVAEEPERGLLNLLAAMALEMQLLTAALGKYSIARLGREDLWP